MLLVAIALLIAALQVAYEGHPPQTPLEFWHLVETTTFVVVLLCTAFSVRLWRWPMFSVGRWLVRVPILPCEWSVTITPLDREAKVARGTIRQTLFGVSIVLETDEIISRSVAAQFRCDEQSDELTLVYVYETEPTAARLRANPRQRGAAVLRFQTGQELVGTYFTDRASSGDLAFTPIASPNPKT